MNKTEKVATMNASQTPKPSPEDLIRSYLPDGALRRQAGWNNQLVCEEYLLDIIDALRRENVRLREAFYGDATY